MERRDLAIDFIFSLVLIEVVVLVLLSFADFEEPSDG